MVATGFFHMKAVMRSVTMPRIRMTSMPVNWAPSVRIDGDRVTVTILTYCGLEKERIYRHTDTYRRGKYRPLKVEDNIEIAEGKGGFLF